jgi:hypothetical protein
MLEPPRLRNALANSRRLRRTAGSGERAKRNRRDLHRHIETVGQGPGYTRPMPGHLGFGADARSLRVTGITARTWVHGANQCKSGWERHTMLRPSNDHLSVFKGLSQSIKERSRHFLQFIEEEHAVMRQ